MAKTDDQKRAYLIDHLPYVLVMLRHAYGRIQTVQEQLDWNLAIDAFFIYARTLYVFLANDDGTNMKAHDFCPGFSVGKTPLTIALLPKINERVLHLGPKRPSDEDSKLKRSDAAVMRDWIEAGFAEFAECLDIDDRKIWEDALVSCAASPASNLHNHTDILGPTTTSTSTFISVKI